MAFSVVIPARFGSTRLPCKPLLDIAGKSMVQRVWEQARLSSAAEVVIATDDGRIQAVAEDFGARVCMTSPDHPSGGRASTWTTRRFSCGSRTAISSRKVTPSHSLLA